MKELGELQPIRSVGQTVEEFFIQAMVEQLKKPFAMPIPDPSFRNEAYYEAQAQRELNPDSDCPCCGRPYESGDF